MWQWCWCCCFFFLISPEKQFPGGFTRRGIFQGGAERRPLPGCSDLWPLADPWWCRWRWRPAEAAAERGLLTGIKLTWTVIIYNSKTTRGNQRSEHGWPDCCAVFVRRAADAGRAARCSGVGRPSRATDGSSGLRDVSQGLFARGPAGAALTWQRAHGTAERDIPASGLKHWKSEHVCQCQSSEKSGLMVAVLNAA